MWLKISHFFTRRYWDCQPKHIRFHNNQGPNVPVAQKISFCSKLSQIARPTSFRSLSWSLLSWHTPSGTQVMFVVWCVSLKTVACVSVQTKSHVMAHLHTRIVPLIISAMVAQWLPCCWPERRRVQSSCWLLHLNGDGPCILRLWCTLKSSLWKKLPEPSTMTK